MKKYSSAVLALILTSTCMTASAATQEISKKAYVCDGNKTMEGEPQNSEKIVR